VAVKWGHLSASRPVILQRWCCKFASTPSAALASGSEALSPPARQCISCGSLWVQRLRQRRVQKPTKNDGLELHILDLSSRQKWRLRVIGRSARKVPGRYGGCSPGGNLWHSTVTETELTVLAGPPRPDTSGYSRRDQAGRCVD
jgi:hypothetical protein